MNKTIYICGASDDLIEIEGDLMAEGSPRGDNEPGYVVLSTGDVFTVTFTSEDDGIWRVKHLTITGKLCVDIKPPLGDRYTDVARVEGQIEWAHICQSWPLDEVELQDLLEDAIERSLVRGRIAIPRDRLIAAIEAIGHPMMAAVKDAK